MYYINIQDLIKLGNKRKKPPKAIAKGGFPIVRKNL